MKKLPLSILLSACAVALTSCDNKPATPAPAPAPAAPAAPAEVKISDAGAASFLEEYKALAASAVEAAKTGDKEKLAPIMAKGAELAAKGKEWLAKLKPEEIEAYKAKLTEYAKPFAEGMMGKLNELKAAAGPALDAAKEKLDAAKEAAKDLIPAPAPAPAPEPAPAPAPAEPAPAPAAPADAPAAPAPAPAAAPN